jgi:hypothetical protein
VESGCRGGWLCSLMVGRFELRHSAAIKQTLAERCRFSYGLEWPSSLRQTLSLSVRRAGVTQSVECLLPKSERLSAVAPRVGVPPNRPSYTLRRPALGMPSSRRRSRWAWIRTAGLHGDAGLACVRSVVDQRRSSRSTSNTAAWTASQGLAGPPPAGHRSRPRPSRPAGRGLVLGRSDPVGIGNPDSITRRRRNTRGSAHRADPVGERRAD